MEYNKSLASYYCTCLWVFSVENGGHHKITKHTNFILIWQSKYVGQLKSDNATTPSEWNNSLAANRFFLLFNFFLCQAVAVLHGSIDRKTLPLAVELLLSFRPNVATGQKVNKDSSSKSEEN
ncbi:hypothetical protein DM860_015761 [Cuscuta australis]|uniref:Uncharacterized protein n=1 Tax=Cuscuta australis TaxID=267555 RepID=A0A328DQU4_9ASTE|nr:hypothetical protein DM860_015761 [Cuscuta australis]